MKYADWKTERERASAAYDRLSRSFDFVVRRETAELPNRQIIATVYLQTQEPGFSLSLYQPLYHGQLHSLGELTTDELAIVSALHRDLSAWVRGERDMPEPETWRP